MVTMVRVWALSFCIHSAANRRLPTLEPALRTDAAALYALARNIGNADGRFWRLLRCLAPAHKRCTRNCRTGNAFQPRSAAGRGGYVPFPGNTLWRVSINAQVQYHALVAAYANDFMLMCWICLPLLPLLFHAKPRGRQSCRSAQVAME
jgi:hypothetical protein